MLYSYAWLSHLRVTDLCPNHLLAPFQPLHFLPLFRASSASQVYLRLIEHHTYILSTLLRQSRDIPILVCSSLTRYDTLFSQLGVKFSKFNNFLDKHALSEVSTRLRSSVQGANMSSITPLSPILTVLTSHCKAFSFSRIKLLKNAPLQLVCHLLVTLELTRKVTTVSSNRRGTADPSILSCATRTVPPNLRNCQSQVLYQSLSLVPESHIYFS